MVQILEARINNKYQTIFYREKVDNLNKCTSITGSSVAENLIGGHLSIYSYNPYMYSSLSRVNAKFHVKLLGSMYIKSNQPSIFKQRV